ncbi:MAG TPA: transglutaminase domain-containing protein [Acidobacteriaceae bacterium]|nr:transglutaminase domain-containing protein [Acidobacteriaceae bacterium]
MTIRRIGAWVWAAVAVSATACAQSNFMRPTPEELSMTSLPGYPGAAAVVLNREETTKDDLNTVFHYERIKILTKDGEKYANVTLPFISVAQNSYSETGDDKTLGEITGRTIHADGTIIPFTGKPYLKVLEKDQDVKRQERVFTLPDVEVGSIIEYRYVTRIADNIYEAPDWYIQGELYVKQAHYVWYPTSRDLQDSHGLITTITWFPILPAGVKIERRDLPHSQFTHEPIQVFELTIKDVPPEVKEAYMPPIASFSYRVMFNFTAQHTQADWWKDEGKDWSKRMDSFADPNSELKKETADIVSGATNDDQKLQKIYAAVMKLENTHYTRAHDQQEDKAEGGHQVKNAADVLSHKRGSETQLAALFVGMARAAGMKAYLMYVPDRSEEIFVPLWESFRQFDDVIAIVTVDGKEMYFDPGCRYCAYGHLAWQHTLVQGLRQFDKGTEFGVTPDEDFKVNLVTRVANLKMDEGGQITGTIDLTFRGADAVEWRHKALSGDEESLNHALRTHLEEMVPKSLQVKVDKIENVAEYEQPLKVSYDVTGTLGTHTGKRILMPSDVFLSGESTPFAEEKRQQAVYFHYPRYVQDAQRINLPATMSVEALPDTARFDLPKQEAYTLAITGDAKGFTTRRNYVQGELLVMPKDYDTLRKFYAQFESKDQESVVLKAAPAVAASGGN